MYKIKNIFTSIAGEGSLVGTPMTFIRFSGCNLSCKFCDTDFSGGTMMTAESILKLVSTEWVCFTGGEPLLQVGSFKDELTNELYKNHKIAVETNGLISFSSPCFSHITVSPKTKGGLKIQFCHDFKMLYPIYEYSDYAEWVDKNAKHCNKFVQPIWGDDKSKDDCIKFVLDNPSWRLSVQTHKYLGVA